MNQIDAFDKYARQFTYNNHPAEPKHFPRSYPWFKAGYEAGLLANQQDDAYPYAKRLAESLFKKHFASEDDYASGRIAWEVCDTTLGVLTQIDNMVCGLVKGPPQCTESDSWNCKYCRKTESCEALKQQTARPKYTTGHCKEKAKSDGCQLHNVQCGYPECDRKEVDQRPSRKPLHVGNSLFESWYSDYDSTGCGEKQRARDAYAAGMDDPLVTHKPLTAEQIADCIPDDADMQFAKNPGGFIRKFAHAIEQAHGIKGASL